MAFLCMWVSTRRKVQDAEEVVYNLVHISSKMIIIQLPHSAFTTYSTKIYVVHIFGSISHLDSAS
jgi:hypothetical protein